MASQDGVLGRGTLARLWTVCLSLSLLWTSHGAQAAIHRHSGPCLYKEAEFQPGQTFYRGCDKCFCRRTGYICLSQMKPTSWPSRCQRLPAECGYRVVYREYPDVRCRAFSWIW